MADRLIDGGFENWTTSTDLTSWTETIAGTSTVTRESTIKRSGKYSCSLIVDASDSSVYIYQTVKLVAGRKYRLVIWYKNSISGKTASWNLKDSGSNVYLQSDGTWGGSASIVLPNSISWRPYVIEFTAHVSYTNYVITIGKSSAASSTIYLDNVSMFSMNVCGFAWDNKWDSGTLTTSGNATNFPANNTRHRWHLRPWRSANLASPEWLVLDAGANIDVLAGFVRYTNFQSNATVLFQANTADSWAAPAANVSVAANTEIIPCVWAAAQSYRYWRIAVTDATNPSNYVAAGRVYFGPVFEPVRNYVLGGGMRADIDPSAISESDDGQASSILKTKYKSGDFSFERITAADKGQFENLYNNVGVAKPFFFCQDMGDPWNEAWYVYISELDITQEYDYRFTVRLSLREAR